MAAASPKQKFDAAVKVIHSLPKDGPFQPSREMMLTFYGFYKQATLGPCNASKPSFWDIVNKVKWEAWNKLGSMDPETAMINYVEELKQTLKAGTKEWQEMVKKKDPRIVEAMPQTDIVGDFLIQLGSFYELVDENLPIDDDKHYIPEEDGDHAGISPDAATLNTMPDIATQHPISDVSTQNALSNTDTHNGTKSENMDGNNQLEKSDSEEEFCDTSMDFVESTEKLQQESYLLNDQIPDIHRVTMKAAKVNHVTFADTVDGNSYDLQNSMKELFHVPRGFPFVGIENGEYKKEILGQTALQPMCAFVHKFSGDVNPEDINVYDVSANNSNHITPTKEMNENEPTGKGGEQAKTHDKKLDHGLSRRSESSTLIGGESGCEEHNLSHSKNNCIDQQITMALIRLQQDMANVLKRVKTLEAQSSQMQEKHSHTGRGTPQRKWINSLWPFSSRASRAALFFLIWPVVVHVLLSYIFKRKRFV